MKQILIDFKWLIWVFVLGVVVSFVLGWAFAGCRAENYLYLSQEKIINGDYKYYLPKLELNVAKYTGKFFNMPCYYLQELEAGLVYEAPRASMFQINHNSIESAYNIGVQVGCWWTTYSLKGNFMIAGNRYGLPEGISLANDFRFGLCW